MDKFNPAISTEGSYPLFDHSKLLELAATKMPFGKFQGRRLVDLPEHYIVWFAGQEIGRAHV